ncbi:MAG: phosphatidylinositol kinase [Actinomycetota bacterium]
MTDPGRVVVEELIGRFAAASNLTLLARAQGALVVYKPTAGVRPLADFAGATLAAREVLTYRVAESMGLGIVPETRLGDGPLGPGALQRFVAQDCGFDPLGLVARVDEALWPVAVLDVVVNNADRKAGHLLAEAGTGRLWAIDHGLTFHPEAKLRTVLWGFAAQAVPPALLEALQRLEAALEQGLHHETVESLGRPEAAALRRRVRSFLRRPVHPRPPRDRYPIPWPPY